MTDRLEQALSFSNYRQTLNNQLQKIKLKADGMLLYAEAGGKFSINQQLMCFIDYLVRNGHSDAIVLDDNGSPILIDDTAVFLKSITTRYFEVTNDYLTASHAIKKMRNVKSIMSIQDA
jgi:hypothetical protein